MKYVRITKHLDDYGKLVPIDEVYSNIDDPNQDWYRSVYYYNDDHYRKFKDTGSVAGITDVITDNIVFDFDSKDLELAKNDTLEIVSRLASHGINTDLLTICFSGNKGFSVEFKTDTSFNPTELKNLCKKLAEGLSTFDTKVYNANRIFRIPLTKHNVTGLFKLPITVNQLAELDPDMLRKLASDSDNAAEWKETLVHLPEVLKIYKTVETKTKVVTAANLSDLDLSVKPKWLSPCKYAILNGFFKPGSRNNALMSLAATIKSQGLPKEVNYRMIKGAAELQSQRSGQERFPDEEIHNNIIEVIYSPAWKGATYSCKDHDFLKESCPVANTNRCHEHKKQAVVEIDSVSGVFANYAKHIDQNTIKSGIESLDREMRMLAGTHIVLAGTAGSGKTSVALNILQNTSDQGLTSLFCSADMGTQLIYQKIAQKASGYPEDKIFNIYKNNSPERKTIDATIAKQYKNVKFDFRRGPTIDELRENILSIKDQYPDTFKLVIFDYIAKIVGPYSDETANMAYIAPKLADIADEAGVCLISLAQVARSKGGPNTPFNDHRIAKGSGAIEESATIVLGVWRPGYNTESDKFITVAGLKMRMGKEFRVDLGFDGQKSNIYELNSDELDELEVLRQAESEKKKDSAW